MLAGNQTLQGVVIGRERNGASNLSQNPQDMAEVIDVTWGATGAFMLPRAIYGASVQRGGVSR